MAQVVELVVFSEPENITYAYYNELFGKCFPFVVNG